MEALERFLAPYPSRSYKKGEMILSIDEKPSHGFAIREGIIKTYNIDSQGNEHPVTLDVKNDFFPLGWIQGHIDLTLYFYEAFTNCTVTCFDRDELKSAMQTDAQLTSEIYFRVSERFLDLQQRIEALEQSRAAHKIIFTS